MGVGIWALLASAFALAAAAVIPIHGDVPAYAMESALLFRLERALAIATALVVPALVLGPLLTGMLPRRLSTDGIDWGEERGTVVDSLKAMNERLDELETALAKMTDLNDG